MSNVKWTPIQPGGHGPGPGQRLRQLRKHIGWSQAEMAILLGVRQATVSDWERAKAFPAPAQQRALRNLVQNPDDVQRWLMEGGEMPEPELKTGEDAIRAVGPPSLPTVPYSAEYAGGFLMARRAEWADLLNEVCASVKEQRVYPASYVCELVARVLNGIDIWLEAMGEAESDEVDAEGLP